MSENKCKHELEYHDCCDSVVCKKCLRVWGGKEVVTVPVTIPQTPWNPFTPWATYTSVITTTTNGYRGEPR